MNGEGIPCDKPAAFFLTCAGPDGQLIRSYRCRRHARQNRRGSRVFHPIQDSGEEK